MQSTVKDTNDIASCLLITINQYLNTPKYFATDVIAIDYVNGLN